MTYFYSDLILALENINITYIYNILFNLYIIAVLYPLKIKYSM